MTAKNYVSNGLKTLGKGLKTGYNGFMEVSGYNDMSNPRKTSRRKIVTAGLVLPSSIFLDMINGDLPNALSGVGYAVSGGLVGSLIEPSKIPEKIKNFAPYGVLGSAVLFGSAGIAEVVAELEMDLALIPYYAVAGGVGAASLKVAANKSEQAD